jgi:hypothetical protein
LFKTFVRQLAGVSLIPGNGSSTIAGSLVVGGSAATGTSAALEVKSTTKGFLLPRLTTAQRDAISSALPGLMVYNTTTSKFQGYLVTSSSSHQQLGGSTQYGLGYSNIFGINNFTNGQTFTMATTTLLNSIEVKLTGSNSSNVTISVYAGDIGPINSIFNFSNPIATSTKNISSSGNIQFDFVPLSLAPGRYYFNVTADNTNYTMGVNNGGGFSDLDSNGQTVNEIFFQTNGSGYNLYQTASRSVYFKLLFDISGWVDLH